MISQLTGKKYLDVGQIAGIYTYCIVVTPLESSSFPRIWNLFNLLLIKKVSTLFESKTPLSFSDHYCSLWIPQRD